MLFTSTLYTHQRYNSVSSITSFISTLKAYQNLEPAILAEGEEQVKISADFAVALPHRLLANATLFMLARNSDVDSAVNSVREVEDKFNRKYGYPWVFLNEEPFSDSFKRCATSPPFPLAVLLGGTAAVYADLTDRRRRFSLHAVACRISLRDPYILGRSPKNIGISQIGSTRPLRRRRGIRWWLRTFYTAEVYREAFPLILSRCSSDTSDDKSTFQVS